MATSLFLLALVALSLGRRSRGVRYYFPSWVGSDWNHEVAAERLDELTNIVRSLPIVLAAAEQSPWKATLGETLDRVRQGLPGVVGERLPHYLASDERPLYWLAMHSGAPEVAQAVSDHWTRWPESLRGLWVFSGWIHAPRGGLTNRAEYLPLLREMCRSTNPNFASSAVELLLQYRPVTAEHAQLVAEFMMHHGRASGESTDQQLAQQLAGLVTVPHEIVNALKIWLTSPFGKRATLSALVLSQLDPAAFPPETVLEPLWLRLAPVGGGSVLLLLNEPEFQTLANSPWTLGFLGRLLAVQPVDVRGATFGTAPPKLAILGVVEAAGQAAAQLTPVILPLLSDTNAFISRAAARAFAAVTPTLPEYVPEIRGHLTNGNAAAPLLLWLTSLGTNAASAHDEIDRLAKENVRFPKRSAIATSIIDPTLARRYGLILLETLPGKSSPNATSDDQNGRKPSEIRVSASQDCPPALARFWPGFEQARKLSESEPSQSTRGSKSPVNPYKLPDSNLAELARRCLTTVSAGLSSPELLPTRSEP